MTYQEFIQNILETRGRFNCGDKYHERHHIIPKCLGGTNDEENLIDLFAREHFEAHRLLTLENPDNEKLIYAWWCMSTMKNESTKERYKISAEEYEEVKIMFSQVPRSEEHKRKLSERAKERMSVLENNPMYRKHHTEETKRKIGRANKGRTPSEESKNESRKYMKDRWEDPNYRDEQSKRMKEVNSRSEYKKKQVESHYGDKSWHACAVINIETRKVYGAATLARDELGIDNSQILKCCKGKLKTAGGYTWKYVYDYVYKNDSIIPGAITLGIITEEEVLEQFKKINNND